MKRDKFFEEVKEHYSCEVGPNKYSDDNYQIADGLVVFTPRTKTVGDKVICVDSEEVQFNSEEELCNYMTTYGKTLGELINEYEGFKLVYSPDESAGGEFRILNEDGTIHKE